jgi:hypothetical protein
VNRSETIEQLRQRGWTIEETSSKAFELPAAISARYPRLPAALTAFLSNLLTCVSRDQTVWFLCRRDYAGTSDSAFRWDEFERMSIQFAEDDEETRAAIRLFWDTHFPFMLSVRNGYAFYAIRTSSDRFGEVVEGCEPIFEEVSKVADSFTDFIRRFLDEGPFV